MALKQQLTVQQGHLATHHAKFLRMGASAKMVPIDPFKFGEGDALELAAVEDLSA
jgi:hypothetical protein